MKGKTLLRALCVLGLAVSLLALGVRGYQYRQGTKEYDEAADLAGLPQQAESPVPPSAQPSSPAETPDVQPSPEPSPTQVWVDPYAEALANMDFAALRACNDEVLGWLLIPGTRVSYPLVQGADNDYYLDHTWRKSWNSVGAIFMEFQCSADLSDFNTIIYGHRVNDRSMFGTLLRYKKQDYLDANPEIWLVDDSGTHVYTIFAAYEAETDSPVYWLGVEREADRQSVIDYALERTVVQAQTVPSAEGQIITLSTCTGNGHDTRWVVQGIRSADRE